MSERLVKIMEMLTADGIKASMDLDPRGRLGVYLWNDTTSIVKHYVILNAHDITDEDVSAVSAMIEAYKKSQPARKALR